ncbi:MAG: hypothetical protein V4692_00785, partial [Bdellovibrionota bacterium]
KSAPVKTAKAVNSARDPAAEKIVASTQESKLKADNEMAREVLERSLPRLKEACLVTKFN